MNLQNISFLLVTLVLVSILLLGCTIKSNDTQYNITNTTINDTKTNHAPNVSITSNNTSGTAPFSPSFHYICKDSDGNLGYCELFSDGQLIANSTITPFPSGTKWPEYSTTGGHVIEIRGTDKEGLTSSAKITFTVTNALSKAPGVLLNLSKTSGPVPFDPINGIYLYCYDPENMIESCEIKIDGIIVASTPNLKNVPTSGVDFYTFSDSYIHPIYMEAGTHTIEVFVRDTEGQNASKSLEFVVLPSEKVYPTRNLDSSDQKLVWPVNCEPGIDCSMGYPDLDQNEEASCGYTYEGHEGTDIGFSWDQMDAGIDVYAAADGVVKWVFDGKYDRCTSFGDNIIITNPDCAPPAESGTTSGYSVCTEYGSYCNANQRINQGYTSCGWCFWGGNVVVILHPDNPYVFATRYDHFKTNSITVSPGDVVKRGQKIGQVGSAGRSSGPHLHFEVWSDWYTPIDPWTPGCNPPWTMWQYS